jgi:hypothetical protein
MGGGTGTGEKLKKIYYNLKFINGDGFPLEFGIDPRYDKDLEKVVDSLKKGKIISLKKYQKKNIII